MSVVSSFIFYNILFAFILILFKKGEKSVLCNRFAFFLLILLAILRFDIGNDYETYTELVSQLTRSFSYGTFSYSDILFSEKHVEPSFVFLVYLFKDLKYSYVYIFAFYSILTIYYWYKALKLNNSLFWGMFAIITLSILFSSFNVIRQSAAMAIFLYSVHFLDDEYKNTKKYVLYILFASIFHTSALIMLLIIPLVNIKPNMKVYIIIAIIFYLGGILGIWNKLINIIFTYSFFYTRYIGDDLQTDARLGSGIMYSVLFIVYLYFMYISKGKYLYTNILFIGLILFCIATGNLNINRISNYFLNVIVLILPYVAKQRRHKNHLIASIFLLLSLYSITLFRGDPANGCIPYDYIGSENFQNGKLRIREYKDY